MILEYTWFTLLTVISWIFAYRVWHELGSDSGNDQLLSHGSMIMAIVLSWDAIGLKAFNYIDRLIPQTGTDIHDFTAFILFGIILIFSVVFPILSAFLFMNKDGQVKMSNFILFQKTMPWNN